MRGKKKNIDNMLDLIISETIKADEKSNFLSNPKAVDLFQSIITNRFEIQQMISLFSSEFLPRTAKLTHQTKQQWRKSRYRKHFAITEEQLKSNFYETVRLGYISIFHKYEGYVAQILPKFQEHFSESCGDGTTLIKFAKDEFNLNLNKHWHITSQLKRINWIVNTCKHNNGYPNPKYPLEYKEFSKGQKLKLSKSDFVKDAKYIEELSEKFNQLVLNICKYKSNEVLASLNDGQLKIEYQELGKLYKKRIKLEIAKMKIEALRII